MEKKNIDWGNLGFGYVQTDYRFVSDFKNGSWDEGKLTEDATVVINECAGVLQYAQTVFEGMKAYTTEDGRIVTFRPDLNAERMENSAKRLEMPVFPKDRFIQAVVDTVKANAAYVPPFGSGATLYIRPYMFGTNPVIGVKPADEYQFRVFTTPVGPYFKGGVKPLTIRVTDFDRAAPHGTGHIKAGLNYAMSMHAIMDAHRQGYDENMYLNKGRGDRRSQLPFCYKRRKSGYSEIRQYPAFHYPPFSYLCSSALPWSGSRGTRGYTGGGKRFC